MSRLFYRILFLLIAVSVWTVEGLRAQVLPVLNSFRDRTFNGVVDVSWPVEFTGCTFITDSVVLRHSYGAVFRNCRFESRSGNLYLAGDGSGMIMADCELTGCDEFMFSRNPSLADRNYMTGVMLDGSELSLQDDTISTIEIDGLELAESVKGVSQGPLLMLMSTDRSVLRCGQTATLRVRGLDDGMFIGWHVSDSTAIIKVGDDPFTCTLTMPVLVETKKTFLVSAYTEYGLEAACQVFLMPQDEVVVPDGKNAEKRSSRKRKR